MGQKTDVAVKLVLVFFVSLLSFSIGTYVGRKYSDNQHQLAQLEPGAHGSKKLEAAHGSEGSTEHSGEKREVASEHGAISESNKNMSDEEIAKLAEEFVADDKAEGNNEHGKNEHGKEEKSQAHSSNSHAETTSTHEAAAKHESATGHETVTKHEAETKHEAASAHEPATKHEAKATHEATPKLEASSHAAPLSAAQTLVNGHTQEKAEQKETHTETTRVPSSIPKDVAQYSVGKFTVQVASYITKEDAEKKSSELQGKGFNAFIVPAQVKGKNYYRVSVGLFATEKEAKDYRVDFMQKSKIESTMIQKISQ